MKISTEIGSIAKHVGERKAVELCAKAGFDGWDFSMFAMAKFNWQTWSCDPTDHPLGGSNYLRFARELRHIGEECGIRCNQSHAPFPVDCRDIRNLLPRALECTAEAGGEICVIHPDNNKSAEENAEMYLELLEIAKGYGVKIATENMWNWDSTIDYSTFAACSTSESFCRHLEIVHDDDFVACLDIGHAEMQGSGSGAVAMIHALGSKLQALHLHDNDRRWDWHQIPFARDIDFPPIIRALKEIGYGGWFTLEADKYLMDYDESTVLQGVKNMAAATARLARMYEEI